MLAHIRDIVGGKVLFRLFDIGTPVSIYKIKFPEFGHRYYRLRKRLRSL